MFRHSSLKRYRGCTAQTSIPETGLQALQFFARVSKCCKTRDLSHGRRLDILIQHLKNVHELEAMDPDLEYTPPMDWATVIDNPLLRDLPFKIELNRFGQILMSPASNKHGRTQSRIVVAMDRRKRSGEVIAECSVQTSDGVKVADVAWASDDFIARFGYETPYPKSPEVCVEITSPSNSAGEIEHKIELYLAKGALEVWVVNEDEEVTIHSHVGRLAESDVVPGFRLF